MAAPQFPLVRPKDFMLEVIDMIIIALVLVFGIVRPLLLTTFFIPSASMEPTLLMPDKDKGIPGDRLIANRFVFLFRTPRRGEIIVFTPPREAVIQNDLIQMVRTYLEQNPKDLSLDELNCLRLALVSEKPYSVLLGNYLMGLRDGTAPTSTQDFLDRLPPYPSHVDDYIKRVIGEPGDHIRIVKNEGVYINGKLLDEPYVNHYVTNPGEEHNPHGSYEGVDYPMKAPPDVLRQTLTEYLHGNELDPTTAVLYGDVQMDYLHDWATTGKYLVGRYPWQTRIAPNIQNGEFVVPKDGVFVMGDNRYDSLDSRYWGVVPLKNIKARGVSTFLPLQRLKRL